MAVNTTGEELKRFFEDKKYWPDGAWFEDDEVLIDGVHDDDIDYMTVSDNAVVKIKYGTVMFNDDKDCVSLVGYFKKWRKEQSTTSFVVVCDRANEAAVRAAITSSGGRAL